MPFFDLLDWQIRRKISPLNASSSQVATAIQVKAKRITLANGAVTAAVPRKSAIKGRLFIATKKHGTSRICGLSFIIGTIIFTYLMRKKEVAARKIRVIRIERRESVIPSPVFINLTSAIANADSVKRARQIFLSSILCFFNSRTPHFSFLSQNREPPRRRQEVSRRSAKGKEHRTEARLDRRL